MFFQLSDIKVVFDRLFRHLRREREREKKNYKNERLLNGKTFQTNLKRMIISQGNFFFSILMSTQCIVGSPEGKHFKNVSNLSHSTTAQLLYFTCKNNVE